MSESNINDSVEQYILDTIREDILEQSGLPEIYFDDLSVQEYIDKNMFDIIEGHVGGISEKMVQVLDGMIVGMYPSIQQDIDDFLESNFKDEFEA